MLRKRILPLFLLLISLSSSLYAQELAAPQANEGTSESNAYQTYKVKKGDTLWGISKRFIEDPYYWPDLWANNPDIQNPHFIFPGQKLRIYAAPIVVVGVEEKKAVTVPAIEESGSETAPVVVEVEQVAVEEDLGTIIIPAGISFISEDELLAGSRIFDFPITRYFAASNDTVFVRVPEETTVKIGDTFNIIKSSDEIIHPVSKKRLGFQVDQIGTLEITALGKDLQTAFIRKNFREIERGAWLMPRRSVQEEISLRRSAAEMTGTIISTASNKEMQGKNEAFFIDLGENNGLKVGNLLTMIRPRQATDLAPELKKNEAPLTYPEELIGYALVVDTNAETATAVILKSLGPAVIGDQVRTQTGEPIR